MARVTFNTPTKNINSAKYERTKQNISDILSPMTCNSGHDAFASVYFTYLNDKLLFDIMGVCCMDFLARANKALEKIPGAKQQ